MPDDLHAHEPEAYLGRQSPRVRPLEWLPKPGKDSCERASGLFGYWRVIEHRGRIKLCHSRDPDARLDRFANRWSHLFVLVDEWKATTREGQIAEAKAFAEGKEADWARNRNEYLAALAERRKARADLMAAWRAHA